MHCWAKQLVSGFKWRRDLRDVNAERCREHGLPAVQSGVDVLPVTNFNDCYCKLSITYSV